MTTPANLAAIFRAGRVLRWHSHARLAGTQDWLDGHAGRVARLIAALHPDPPASLLIAALIHDDGEQGATGIGDIPGHVKEWLEIEHVEAARALETLEVGAICLMWTRDTRRGLPLPATADAILYVIDRDERGGDYDWLYLADRLDRLMWVSWHRPALLQAAPWQTLAAEVGAEAARLGVALDVGRLLEELARDEGVA